MTGGNAIAIAFERFNVGGLDVLHAPRPGSGLVAATLLMRRGSADESAGEHGLAGFTVAMLMRGTRQRSSQQLAHELESLGAFVRDHDGQDGCSIGLRVATPEAEAALALVFETVRAPAFDAREHEVQREELLAHLRMVEDDKFGFTWRECVKALFAGHGYGHSTEGEAADVKAIAPDDCRRWHHETARPEACLLVVVGDMETERLHGFLESQLDGWENRQTVRSRRMDEPAPVRREPIELRKPDLQQGFVVGAYRLPSLTHADYPALRLASAALGEGFAGRIFTRLRDQRGLAYACGATLIVHRLAGQQAVYIGTKPETIDEARAGLLDEAEQIRRDLLSAEELERARQYVIGKFSMGLQSHGQRAGKLAAWEDLTGDATLLATYPDRLREVTAEQVREAAARWWVDPTFAILRPE